ncbi:MAG: DUF4173 domain-containing protein [Clostridiales bacterium]|nr:DUF4173 domain-containing protein [Clostridiales bacterium]
MTITNAKQRILAERLLLPIALALAILFDRLMVANIFQDLTFFSAIFWLCYLAIFYAFYWSKLKRDSVAWFVAICVTALCIWNFAFGQSGHNWQFAAITFFVIPAVLMAHAQWTACGFTLKNSEGMALAWIFGAFVKPFTGLVPLFEAVGSLFTKKNRPLALRVLIGAGVAVVVMAVIIPLLMGADQVFNHYISRIFANFNIRSLLFHLTVIIIAFGLFYSFLWNIGMGENKIRRIPEKFAIDPVISGIVLGSVILIYILFCIIQFTYLFAGAGLPAGLTYAEYARAGFAQTVAVCAINLLIFGIFLRFGPKEAGRKFLRALLMALLALTVVMLISGAVRLNLYIEVFGMTWLRLLSAWFILYMAATVALCAIRLFWKRLPVLVLAALLLLIWYVALGYLNPDAFIAWFN